MSSREILRPSSYKLHRANNNGDKVTNRPLYVEELKNLRREGINSAQDLKTETGIRNFTEAQFITLANAIRDFREQVKTLEGAGAADEQALRAAAKPILYSREREAVHRFIRDMVRQLKRAGVPAEDLSEIRALIPDKPGGAQALFQGLVPGTGKQMRLQDEAERMAKALPKVLRLTAAYGEKLQENLMQFDLSGVQAFSDYVNNDEPPSSHALEFIKSFQGQAFVDAIVEKGIELFGPQLYQVEALKTRNVRKDPDETLRLAADLLKLVLKLSSLSCPSLDHLVQENQHLFMMTSDPEFWETEAVGKAATRLTQDSDINSTKKSRIFKQMKLRAAAMGVDAAEVDAYMIQGIANTLRNRNMVIEGTKIAGVIGSVAGNISSTPLSVVAAPHAPFLALPGIMDLALMPAGWAIGQIPGAIFGATVLNDMKRARLQEAKDSGGVMNSDLYRVSDVNHLSATYTSASKSIRFSRKNLAKLLNAEKPALMPMARGSFSQYKHAHGQVWKGMAKEISSLVWTPIRYVFSTGPQDAWKDLVIHNDPAQWKRQTAERLKDYMGYYSSESVFVEDRSTDGSSSGV
ncbi:hypothetical protein [Noviherbaspirillum malthae]|uniref:hypothetical protein n=1 Tax=Noviherbaspirillum malthae TaxID=1260987 RepID=UPI00188E1C04|nr:hypothetical protein [Noviherbaspirillum malthae]